jgi:hypothetical protein
MTLGNIAVWICHAFSRPNNIYAGKSLISIDDTLRLALLKLVPIGVEHALG